MLIHHDAGYIGISIFPRNIIIVSYYSNNIVMETMDLCHQLSASDLWYIIPSHACLDQRIILRLSNTSSNEWTVPGDCVQTQITGSVRMSAMFCVCL